MSANNFISLRRGRHVSEIWATANRGQYIVLFEATEFETEKHTPMQQCLWSEIINSGIHKNACSSILVE